VGDKEKREKVLPSTGQGGKSTGMKGRAIVSVKKKPTSANRGRRKTQKLVQEGRKKLFREKTGKWAY